SLQRRAVLVREPPLLADAPVPQLGECFGHLDRETVQQEVVAVAVGGEQLALARRRELTDRDGMERRVVDLARVDRAEEVADAEEAILLLAGEREPEV